LDQTRVNILVKQDELPDLFHARKSFHPSRNIIRVDTDFDCQKLRLCTIRGQARALNDQELGNHHRRGDVMATLLLNANEGVQFGLADINRVH
jgi:hypothetical protein